MRAAGTVRRLTPRFHRWLKYQAAKGMRQRVEGPPEGGRLASLSSSTSNRLVRVLSERKLPSILCLDRNYLQTIETLTELRKFTLGPRTGRLLQPTGRRVGSVGWVRNATDFTPLQSISAGAALMLAAEYDRISRLSGFAPATIDLHDWHPEVKATLAGLGFFKLLRLEVDVEPAQFGVIIEPMLSGSDVNMEPVNAAIASLFAKGSNDPALRLQMASAVTDAVENVRGHAYPEGWFKPRLSVPRWWFTGAVDQAASRVTLAIYDQGITIPSALPLKWDLKLLARSFKQLFSLDFDADNPKNDGPAIDMAMQLAASSTGLPYRGKGLPKILEIIRSCPEGRLRVVSRSGECIYGADGSKVINTHETPMMGTYLELEALFSAAGAIP
jgi:hypothetical protein